VKSCDYFPIVSEAKTVNKAISFYISNELIGIGKCCIRFDEVQGLRIYGNELAILLANGELHRIGLASSQEARALKGLLEQIMLEVRK